MIMKKAICLLLSLLMLMGCVTGLAESTKEEPLFLIIREGKTAKVFQAPGDVQAIDTLKAGQFCGLIEETTSGGSAWYYVFYLSSDKKGCLGYIAAGDAEKLSEDDVAALLADPDKADSLLDLISALLDSEEEQTAGSNQSGGSGRRAKIRKGLQMLKTAAQKVLQSKAVERLRNRVGGGKIVDRVKNRISNLKEKVKNLSKNEKVQNLTKDVLDAIVKDLLSETN